MDQQEYIDELIIKCLSGEAGVDESKELSRWMRTRSIWLIS